MLKITQGPYPDLSSSPAVLNTTPSIFYSLNSYNQRFSVERNFRDFNFSIKCFFEIMFFEFFFRALCFRDLSFRPFHTIPSLWGDSYIDWLQAYLMWMWWWLKLVVLEMSIVKNSDQNITRETNLLRVECWWVRVSFHLREEWFNHQNSSLVWDDSSLRIRQSAHSIISTGILFAVCFTVLTALVAHHHELLDPGVQVIDDK